MTTLKHSLAVALCCSLSLVGCNDDATVDEFRISARPVPLEGALLYSHQVGANNEALIVDVTGTKPKMSSYALAAGEVKSYVRPGSAGRQVVVLTQGVSPELSDGRRDGVGAVLFVFDRAGEVFRKELDGRFSDLTLSQDGRMAIAHGHGQGGGVDVGNTVAIVDLSDPGADARKVALSDNTGRAVESFAFPEATDGSRRLMLARGVDTLSLLELDHLERTPKEIPIKLGNDSRSLRPGKVIFRPNEIFVQIVNSSDVLVLQLVPDVAGSDAFTVAPLYLSTAANVLDIELVREGGPERRLVALGQGKVSVVDPVTGDATSSSTDSSFSDLIRFEGRSPVDDQIKERGLLLPTLGTSIAFVDFASGGSWSDQNVETLDLPDSLKQVIPLSEHRLVVLGYSQGGMGLVDLDTRKVTPIGTGSTVNSAVVDEFGGEARLWLSMANDHVASIDLLRLEAQEIVLNEAAQELVLIEGTPRQVAALHDSPGGFITLLDPADLSRASARELVSFFYTDILD